MTTDKKLRVLLRGKTCSSLLYFARDVYDLGLAEGEKGKSELVEALKVVREEQRQGGSMKRALRIIDDALFRAG